MKGGINLDISDLRRLEGEIKALGGVPQRCVTKAARKGANVILKAARKNAPKKTGNLRRGMKLKGEKSRIKGKKVYQVTFRADMNEIFQKKNKEGKIVGYYPVSQEYGFIKRNGEYKPGKRYMKQAAEEHGGTASGMMIQVLSEEVDKEWQK